MKLKQILFLLIICLPLSAMSQSLAEKLASNYEGKKGYTSVNISKSMFKMLSRISTTDPEYKDFQNFLSNLEGVKILIQEDAKNNALKNDLTSLAHSLTKNGYEELMNINEEGNIISFKTLEKNNRIRELVMSITGEDTVLMIISGDFLLDELTSISDNVNIGGMDQVKKLKSKKK